MKIFILEDDQDRIDSLNEWLDGHDVTIVDSCDDLAEFKPPYDLILLDHDLGGRQLVEHEDNGLSFLKQIIEQIGPNCPVVLHSYNLDGRKAMRGVLDDYLIQYYDQPFGPVMYKQLLHKLVLAHNIEHHEAQK